MSTISGAWMTSEEGWWKKAMACRKLHYNSSLCCSQVDHKLFHWPFLTIPHPYTHFINLSIPLSAFLMPRRGQKFKWFHGLISSTALLARLRAGQTFSSLMRFIQFAFALAARLLCSCRVFTTMEQHCKVTFGISLRGDIFQTTQHLAQHKLVCR